MLSFIDFCIESPDPRKDLGLVRVKLLRKDGSVDVHYRDPKKSIKDFLEKTKKHEKDTSKSPIVDHDVEI